MKKVTDEELKQIISYRRAYDDLSFRYGKIEFAIRALDRERTAVEAEFDRISEEEAKFFAELEEKYGAGEIDLQTGEIVTQSE